MTTPYGLSAAGFLPKRVETCVTDLQEDFRATFGNNTPVHAASVFGQAIGISASRNAELWAEAEDVYASGFLQGASGLALDDLLALAGISRQAATYSSVVLTLSGFNGTVIPEGSLVEDAAGTRWVTTTDGTISSGTATVNARPSVKGPVVAFHDTITTVVTTIVGWSSVTNAHDAIPGRNVESDAAARERLIQSFFAGGGSSVDAITAVLLHVSGVIYARVVENTSSFPDIDGRPAHSFEAIVQGGSDQAVFDALWSSKPAGIEAWGANTNGSAVDSQGYSHPIGFTRPDDVDVYIAIEYSRVDESLSATAVETSILEYVIDYGTTLAIGQDVFPLQIIQHIETANLKTMVVYVGLLSSPSASDPLSVDLRKRARFDSSRITITEV